MKILLIAVTFILTLGACAAKTTPPTVGTQAPLFLASTHDGAAFDLEARRGKWTVLYFYPKDGTPGCTKQACAFRDATKSIEALGANVFGISRDSRERHAEFVAEHKLGFSLIADDDGRITQAYGVSGLFGLSKRWTFIVDPALLIRSVDPDVDPALDAKRVSDRLREFQDGAKPAPGLDSTPQ